MTVMQLLNWAKRAGPTDQEGKVCVYYAERDPNNKIK